MEFTEVTDWGELEEVLHSTKSCIASRSPFTAVFPGYDQSKVARDDFEQNPAVRYYTYSNNGEQGYIRVFQQREDKSDVGFVDYVCPMSSDAITLLQVLLSQTNLQRLYVNRRQFPHLSCSFENKQLHLEKSPRHADNFRRNNKTYEVIVLRRE